MSDIQVSIYGTCNRPHLWQWFYDNLAMNKVNFEIIFVGNVEPAFTLPDNFHFVYSNTKPTQCLHIGVSLCTGEILIGISDDVHFSPYFLDTVYELYKKQNNYKSMIGPKFFGTLEPKTPEELQKMADSTPNDTKDLHLIYNDFSSMPLMAGGAMSNQLFKEVGGYDRRFVWGFSDLDIQIRATLAGAKIVHCENAWICERKDLCPGWNSYNDKGKTYEQNTLGVFLPLWFKDNIFTAENFLGKRTSELEPFENNDYLLSVSQGPKGEWD